MPISTLSQARLHASVLLLCGILFLRLRSAEPPFRVNDAAPDLAFSWAVRSAAKELAVAKEFRDFKHVGEMIHRKQGKLLQLRSI